MESFYVLDSVELEPIEINGEKASGGMTLKLRRVTEAEGMTALQDGGVRVEQLRYLVPVSA